MRTFETRGPVTPEKNYVVRRQAELADFICRVKEGRYIVIFAPRQTGKTTFFRAALQTLAVEEPTYFPIELNFQVYKNVAPNAFYGRVYRKIRQEIEGVFHQRGQTLSDTLNQFLRNGSMHDHLSLLDFFEQLAGFLAPQRVVLIIDEFDGMPATAVSDFLYALRDIYHSKATTPCPYSIGIVGVKNITQLNYDRSISPFNVQDEFALPNFTLEQVQELLGQYTDEVGQTFDPDVIALLHRQTGGQPFLVNRLAQMLTEDMDIPKAETIAMPHFAAAHRQLLEERNVNITHLTTNIRRDPRFQRRLMQITSYDESVSFNLDDDILSELATYGVIAKGTDGMCEIANPIYLYRILQTFQPLINGLEEEYYSQDTGSGYRDYLTPAGQIRMAGLLDN